MTPTPEQINREMLIATRLVKHAFVSSTTIATALATARLEGREKALDEAAGIAKVQWLKSEHGTIADADALCAVCEDASDAILALKEKT